MRKAIEITVYWDSQDSSNEGWAYRLTDSIGDIESGAIDADDLEEAIEQAISESGLEIEACEFSRQPHIDGGYATWSSRGW